MDGGNAHRLRDSSPTSSTDKMPTAHNNNARSSRDPFSLRDHIAHFTAEKEQHARAMEAAERAHVRSPQPSPENLSMRVSGVRPLSPVSSSAGSSGPARTLSRHKPPSPSTSSPPGHDVRRIPLPPPRAPSAGTGGRFTSFFVTDILDPVKFSNPKSDSGPSETSSRDGQNERGRLNHSCDTDDEDFDELGKFIIRNIINLI